MGILLRSASSFGEGEWEDRHDDAVEEDVGEDCEADGQEDEELRGADFQEEGWRGAGMGSFARVKEVDEPFHGGGIGHCSTWKLGRRDEEKVPLAF